MGRSAAPRLVLVLLAALVLAGAPAPTAAARSARARPKNPTVLVYTVNQKETMRLRLRDAQGKPVPARPLQKRFDRLMRCHYTNVMHTMNPRLMRLLYATGKHWPGHRLEVVSGYRHPDVAKNPRSPHMKGLACDFRVEGVKNTELRDYLRKSFKKVGVGYYPNSTFVHLDVRKDRSAFWIDYSGPGDRAMYSETPEQDMKNGRADAYHPTKIDGSWADDAPLPAADGNNPSTAHVQAPAGEGAAQPKSTANP